MLPWLASLLASLPSLLAPLRARAAKPEFVVCSSISAVPRSLLISSALNAPAIACQSPLAEVGGVVCNRNDYWRVSGLVV